jgi:formate/nitrite transporter FocA (FNT family)
MGSRRSRTTLRQLLELWAIALLGNLIGTAVIGSGRCWVL